MQYYGKKRIKISLPSFFSSPNKILKCVCERERERERERAIERERERER